MPLLDYVLRPPSYGWKDQQGALVKPTRRQVFAEYFSRTNVLKTRKNWLGFYDLLITAASTACLLVFVTKFLNAWTALAFAGGIFAMSIHQTVWFHRYCSHRAFTFRNNFWRFVTQNLVIRFIPEEVYAISHHVHHTKSDQPGDPYNATAGFWYCYLAAVIHQPIAWDLDEQSYEKVKRLMEHTGIRANSYTQYQRWGTYTHPARALLSWSLNCSFWYVAFYLVGGHTLAFAMFGTAGFWLMRLRAFNYAGHAKGNQWQREGKDFYAKDRSINQPEYGIIAGEWHNNHHLFPNSARTGFKPYQLDFAFYFIRLLNKVGIVTSYKDAKKQFYEKHYLPYLENRAKKEQQAATHPASKPASG